MTFIESIKTCYKKYFNCKGRATRAEYWWFVLYLYISMIFFVLLGYLTECDGLAFGLIGVQIFVSVAPYFMLRIRRLHDIGLSAWWLLLALIPYLGALIFFIFSVMKSGGDNKYGLASSNNKMTHDKFGRNINIGDDTRFMPQNNVLDANKSNEE